MQFDTGTVAIVATLLIQTAALFFAGGKMWQLLQSHDAEISYTKKWRHDDVTHRLYKVDELWRIHEEEGNG